MRGGPHHWQWVFWGALAITIISLYPQLLMWTIRGREWNGAYAEVQGDEWFYSGYVQALIDGRPRRTDPYTGRDDTPENPQPESFLSIQFVPAYLIAVPARILGVSAATAFIALAVIASILAYLCIYWLFVSLLNDDRLSAVGSLVVLCLGGLVARQGLIHLISSGNQYAFVPFLRRFEPVLPFPIFFLFCGALWRALTNRVRSLLWASVAGLSLIALIFSYFYLWTAACAWLSCLAVVWLLTQRERTWHDGRVFLTVIAMASAALIPYFILLSRRSDLLAAGKKLPTSHAPDLFRGPELLGLAVILCIGYSAYRQKVDWRNQTVVFALSCALMPFIVFNQQVITGLSLQPFHYEMFIANYLVLVGAVLVVSFLLRSRLEDEVRVKKIATYVALIVIWWAAMEVVAPTRVLKKNYDFIDQGAAVGKRLRILVNSETEETDRSQRSLALVSENKLAMILPTFAPQGVLWAPHFDYLHIGYDEGRDRFYKYLYYTGITPQELDEEMRQRMSTFAGAAFGHERVIPDLSINAKPITNEEIVSEIANYDSFCRSFTREQASTPLLSYVIVPNLGVDLTNLDRWYDRDTGEQINSYILYRVRLRQ